jgi:hypothetical protein
LGVFGLARDRFVARQRVVFDLGLGMGRVWDGIGCGAIRRVLYGRGRNEANAGTGRLTRGRKEACAGSSGARRRSFVASLLWMTANGGRGGDA